MAICKIHYIYEPKHVYKYLFRRTYHLQQFAYINQLTYGYQPTHRLLYTQSTSTRISNPVPLISKIQKDRECILERSTAPAPQKQRPTTQAIVAPI